MPTLFGSLMGALGSPDPIDQMEAYADAQRDQNRAAVDPNNPAAGPPAANAAGAATTMPPGQVPNSAKSDPSMGHMIAELARRQQAEQGFNQALGMGFGAFAQPRDREAVDKMFNVAPLDASKLGESIMAANSNQQGQDRTNALLNFVNSDAGKQLAAANNMTPEQLRALAISNPGAIAELQKNIAQPTDQMRNLQQIDRYIAGVQQSKPGTPTSKLESLRKLMVNGMGGPDAEQMLNDQDNYTQTHGYAPKWADNPGAYKAWRADQDHLVKSQSESGLDLSGNINKTEELRTKLSDLRNDPGMQKIMNSAPDSPLRLAVRNALRTGEGDDSWRRDVANQALINDPQALEAVSNLKEITGQEYGGSIQSLLGHGLRPSQTEVQAVREGFGQTKNIDLFGDMKSFNAQAIDPLMTRLDEAESIAYGNSGQIKNMPERLRPFTDKVFLTGGSLHADDGAAPEDWEKKVHMTMPQSEIDAAKQAIHDDPRNAFHVRDFYKRKGYDISPLAYIPGASG